MRNSGRMYKSSVELYICSAYWLHCPRLLMLWLCSIASLFLGVLDQKLSVLKKNVFWDKISDSVFKPVRSIRRTDVQFHSAPVHSSRISHLSVPAVLQWPWKTYRFNIISYLVRTIITVQHDLIRVQILYICQLKEYCYTVTYRTICLSRTMSVPGMKPWLPLLKGHVTHLPPRYYYNGKKK